MLGKSTHRVVEVILFQLIVSGNLYFHHEMGHLFSHDLLHDWVLLHFYHFFVLLVQASFVLYV